jgi:hypothetical protein
MPGSTISEVVGSRRRHAAARAVDAAEKLRHADELSPALQLEAEEALRDLSYYDGIYKQLAGTGDLLQQYRQGAKHSILADLWRSQVLKDRRSGLRLAAHRRAQYADDIEQRDVGATSWSTVPVWLQDKAPTVRAAPLSALLAAPLPDGARGTMNAPRFGTAPVAAAQTALNAAITEPSIVEAATSPAVRTYAVKADVSIQLLEQGSVGIDQALIPAMVEAVAGAIEDHVTNGSGSSGQLAGLIGAAGTAVSYTDATPTLVELWPFVEQAVRAAEGGLGGQPVLVMHPRRLAWLRQKSVTETGTTLYFGAPSVPEAACSVFGGVNIIASTGVPTTAGAGTEDVIVVLRDPSVATLWLSAPIVDVGPSAGSGETAYINVRQYAALGIRLAAGIATVGGTGLIAP